MNIIFNIYDLPYDMYQNILLNNVTLYDILNFCSTCKSFNKNAIFNEYLLNIIQNAQLGWNYCLENNLLESLKLLQDATSVLPFCYDSVNNLEYYAELEKNIRNAFDQLHCEFYKCIYKTYSPIHIENYESTIIETAGKLAEKNKLYRLFVYYHKSKKQHKININDDDVNDFNNYLFYINKKNYITNKESFLINNDKDIINLDNLLILYHKCNISIQSDNELSFYAACKLGYDDIIRWLYKKDYNLQYAFNIIPKNYSTVKLLCKLALKNNIKINVKYIFYKLVNNLQLAKYFLNFCLENHPDKSKKEIYDEVSLRNMYFIGIKVWSLLDRKFKKLCINQNIETVDWLCTINEDFKIIKAGDKIIKYSTDGGITYEDLS